MRVTATVEWKIEVDTEIPEGYSTDNLTDLCLEAAANKLMRSGPDYESVDDIELVEEE